MLKTFKVRGYRTFKNFELSNLSRVNVFVGKNNAGKSSLLEAIYLYGERCDSDVFRRIASKRGEMAMDLGDGEFLPEISHFFLGHEFKTSSSFVLGGDEDKYKVDVLEEKRGSSDHFFPLPVRGMLSNEGVLVLRVQKTMAANKWRTIQNLPVTARGILLDRFARFPRSKSSLAVRDMRFISPDILDYQLLAKMWNHIITLGKEGEVVEALKILTPKVNAVQFLLTELDNYKYAPKSSAGIVVGLQGTAMRVPLGSLGDGMRRLLGIAMALLCVEKGALYIDEIDVGFHYSIMQNIWEFVLAMAQRTNIQVFISTHSLDCLKGLSAVCAKDSETAKQISLYALHSPDEDATQYSGSEVVTAIRNEIEVRS